MRTLTTLAMSAVIGATMLFNAAPASAQGKLTDPEIAHVAVTANQIDVDAGMLAKSKTKDAEVKKFAETMINDHKAVIKQASALVMKLKVTPMDNALSKTLKTDAEKTRKTLSAKSGKDFDKAYIDNEVAYHRAVISTVQNTLIPQTSNKELKALLEKVVPTLKAHLEHAEMMQKKYASK